MVVASRLLDVLNGNPVVSQPRWFELGLYERRRSHQQLLATSKGRLRDRDKLGTNRFREALGQMAQ